MPLSPTTQRGCVGVSRGYREGVDPLARSCSRVSADHAAGVFAIPEDGLRLLPEVRPALAAHSRVRSRGCSNRGPGHLTASPGTRSAKAGRPCTRVRGGVIRIAGPLSLHVPGGADLCVALRCVVIYGRRMRRRQDKPHKRSAGPQLRWREVQLRVGDEAPTTHEGPPTIMEFGYARGRVSAERAALLAEQFRAVAHALLRPGLDARDRHAYADAVEDVWFALLRPGVQRSTRLAMLFLESLERAARKRLSFEIQRAIVKEVNGYPLDETDRSALRRGATRSLDRLRAVIRGDLERGDLHRWFSWSMYADYEPAEWAREFFSVANSAKAVSLDLNGWMEALNAFDRGAWSKRSDGGMKWTRLASALQGMGLWVPTADQLRAQWQDWRNRRGIRTPLFVPGYRQQAAVHEDVVNEPKRSDRKRATRSRTAGAPRARSSSR